MPRTILSDNGREFIAKLNKKLIKRLGIMKVLALPYHPQTNGQVERFNKTLKSMIKKFCNAKQDN